MEKTMTAKTAKTASVKKTALTGEACAGGIFGIMGLLCGAFVMLGSFNPVGIACIMAFLGEGIQFYFAVLTVTAGFLLGNMDMFITDYAVAVLLCALYGLVRDRSQKVVSAGEKALTAFVIFVLSGGIKGFIENDMAYVLTVYLMEGLVIFSLVFIFDRGVTALKAAVSGKSIDRADVIGLAAISAFAAAGAASVYNWTIPIHIILGFYIILLWGRLFGTEAGAAAGVLTGAAFMFGGLADTKMFVLLCVSAMFAGALRNSGRILTAAGCLASAAALAYYFGILDISFVLGVSAACIMFIISAERAAKALSAAEYSRIGNGDEHYAGLLSYVTGRLMDCCYGLETLYKSLSAADRGREKAKKETEELADKVACTVCINCPRNEICWNSSFYNTYQTLLSLFSSCEKEGKVSADDLPSVFRDYCVKQDEFAEAVNVTYSAHRERIIWKMRLNESRQIAREQLSAASDMMRTLAEEIENRAGVRENLERVLLYELRRNDPNVTRVTVDEGEHGEYEVAVYKNGCEGRQKCRDRTIDTVSAVLGRKMKRMEKECGPDEKGQCRLVLCEKSNFRISAAAAMAIRDDEKISGDSYSFMELPKGGYMIALSDGMGSGKAAGDESRTVIELLEQFAESGFKRETALKMINSVLVMGTDEESFATLDMCYIDLYTGSAEFIKTGAAATYVIREQKARAIRSSSLPIGMLKYFDMDRAEYKLKKNDIILMLTDGAAEVIDRDGMSDVILTELMKNNKMKDPKDIANYVLESLKERSGFRIQDDMTVVAARVW